jgi:hypothetical protein
MSERSGVYDCFGPFERMGVRIMGLNKAINGLTQLPHRSEAGTPQGVAAQDAEPALHLVQPAARVGV